jgi:hypothetical protein
MASIYNENGEQFQDLEISNVDGNIAGLSYVDASGNKQTISINLANVDITDPRAIAEAIAHETVDIGKHQANEGNAIARGSMVSAIMDMMNYGNANTNDLTTEQWLANNKDSSVLSLGNTNLRSNINNASSGNGTANALFRELGAATITTALKIAGVTGKEVEIKNSGEDVFATAGDAIYGIAGLNKQGQTDIEKDVKQAVHAGEEYQKLSNAVDNAAYAILSNPVDTLKAIGNMPLSVLDGINKNPLETLFMAEGYSYALDEYNQGYYATAGIAAVGSLYIDIAGIGNPAKAGVKTGIKETIIKEVVEHELVYGSKEGFSVAQHLGLDNVPFEKLNVTGIYSSNKANKELFNTGIYVDAPILPNTTVIEGSYKNSGNTLIRNYDNVNSGLYGRFTTMPSEIEGLSVNQIRNKLALPTPPTSQGIVYPTSSDQLRFSIVNPNYEQQGGKIQVELLNTLDRSQFEKLGDLIK